ncbi:FtsK/SpoIIIE family DNA translocase [Clostridium fallax]|uniref:DNA translocase FtsK n=1 Tax=Clostridium fallax TaxID=1533 RepID=A0A1M4V3V3_9CLOT|nr:DNA translocase FtsK [Clostridium fallax]SHE63666.1 DNA translocase FtsK [Clostridium fallax]SQB06561.1 cell division protein FtsK [Clostridium fallax]
MARKRQSRRSNTKKKTDIKGVLYIVVAILLAISLYSDSVGYLSYFSKKIFVSLIGIGAFVLPIYLVYIAIIYIRNKGKFALTNGFILGTIIFLNTLLFVQTLSFDNYYDSSSITNSLSTIINSGKVFHGGIIGYLITYPIHKLVGSLGTYIIIIAVYIICAMVIFDISLGDIIDMIKEGREHGIKLSKTNDKNEGTIIMEKQSPLIEIKDENSKKEDEIKGINKKIKILDFMKNSVVENTTSNKEEIYSKEPEIEVIEYDSKSNKKQSLDNEVKECVNKELSEKLKDNKIQEEYIYPTSDLLNTNSSLNMKKEDKKDLLSSANKLEETLSSFGVEAKVTQVTKGPSVTRFELQPSAGVKVSKIVNLSDDIALSLAANGVRIEAPIPGKSAVGIEVPNKDLCSVFLKEVIDSDEFLNSHKNLAFAIGKDIGGKCVVGDLSKMPHMLIAGATGSGKSVCINTIIISLLYKYSPNEVKLLMVDPKVVELNVYNGIPHLLIPVVTDPKKAAAALNWAVNEMTRRYKLFADNGVKNIESYNNMFDKGIIEEKLPWIVIIVDELADLMMVCPHDVEDYIGRLAQMARAAGMHLVIATQRPSVDVITGVIKANIPSRISFAVSSQVDSRTILDSSGAEKLLGKGDMLFYPVGESKPLRIQGAFISEEEIERVVDFVKGSKQDVEYEKDIIEHINNEATNKINSEEKDELLDEAIKIVVESGQASTSFLQRKLRIGFNRASRIMDQLEENNIISQKDGSKPRQVLISKSDIDNIE